MGEWVLQEGTGTSQALPHPCAGKQSCVCSAESNGGTQGPAASWGFAISSTPTIPTQVRKGLVAPSCDGPHSQRALCPLPTAGSDPGTPHLTQEQPSGAQDDKT